MTSCKTVETFKMNCNIIEKTLVNGKYNMYWFNDSEITETDYNHWKEFFKNNGK